jgi:hypothetical protein
MHSKVVFDRGIMYLPKPVWDTSAMRINLTLAILLLGGFMAIPADAAPTVKLTCIAPQGALDRGAVDSVCKYVSDALLSRSPGLRIVADGNDIDRLLRVEIAEISKHGISGRLAWARKGDALVAGPLITTTIMDATLNDRSLREFAKGIVQATKIGFLDD